MSSPRWTEEQLADFRRRARLMPPRQVAAEIMNVPFVPPKESKLERRFAQQLAESDLPPHQRNYFFLPDRDFEFDFAWSSLRVAVEIQGMAHRVKGKFKADIEKRALALLAGWRVLELGGEQVRSGQGLEWLRSLLESVGPGSR